MGVGGLPDWHTGGWCGQTRKSLVVEMEDESISAHLGRCSEELEGRIGSLFRKRRRGCLLSLHGGGFCAAYCWLFLLLLRYIFWDAVFGVHAV